MCVLKMKTTIARIHVLMIMYGMILYLILATLLITPVAALSTLLPIPNIGLQPLQDNSSGLAILGVALGAGLAVGLAGIGSAIGMGTASAAALGAITEKPETFGKSILYVVFIEAIGVYGLAVAMLLLGYMPSLLT